MSDQQITFQRGPYEEVYPLPLLAGMTGAECLRQLEADAFDSGNPLQRVPTRGESREGMERVGMGHVQKRLEIAALDGRFDEIPEGAQLEARGLHLLVVEEGEPMSVRPFLLEDYDYATFRPVFQRVEDGWRLGDPEHGKSLLITAATPGAALQQAFIQSADWMEEEDKQILATAKEMSHSLTTAYLSFVLGSLATGEEQALPNGWSVLRTRHDIYGIAMGEHGLRGIDATAPVLARALVWMAAAIGEPLRVPPVFLLELAARCEPRLPNFAPVEEAGVPLTWRGPVSGEHEVLGDWIASYTARQMPTSGKWGVLGRQIKGKKQLLEIARIVVVGSGKERRVELRGLQDPLAGKTIATWEPHEIQEVALRPDLTAVAPLVWALWEVFQALDAVQAKGK